MICVYPESESILTRGFSPFCQNPEYSRAPLWRTPSSRISRCNEWNSLTLLGSSHQILPRCNEIRTIPDEKSRILALVITGCDYTFSRYC